METAIEWYIKKIKEARQMCDDTSMEMDIWHTLDVLIEKGEQAKEMEKEQICNAWYNSLTKGDYNSADEYYNETYKTETIVTEYRDGTIDVETFE